MSLIYAIDEHAAHPFSISIHRDRGERSRQYYIDTIAEFAQSSEIPLLNALAKIHGSCSRPMNRIPIPDRHAKEILQLLSKVGKAKFRDKPLFIDLFTIAKLTYEVSKDFALSGILTTRKDCILLDEVEKLALGDFPFFIHNQTLRLLPKQIHERWFRKVYPKSRILSGKELEDFVETFKDPPAHAPELIWSNPPTMQVSMKPILRLKDDMGGFADLWIEYGANDQILFHDICSTTKSGQARNVLEEKIWEKDLLEVGFVKKFMEYYCPSNEIYGALSFLLEMGWEIFDKMEKKVLLQTGSSFQVSDKEDAYLFEGEFEFGDSHCNITKLDGIKTFVSLGDVHVGLLNRKDLPEEVINIEGLIREENGILVPRMQMGLLPERLMKGFEEHLPSKAFHGELLKYQLEGLSWMEFIHRNRLGGVLADEMGLGKTIQTLALFSIIKTKKPHLVVVPTSLLFQWAEEKKKFLPSFSHLLYVGENRKELVKEWDNVQIIFTSYGILLKDEEFFSKREFECIVLDEAQRIKNRESLTFKAAEKLQGRSRFALTGTPLENHASDLWTLFAFLLPGLINPKKISLEIDRKKIKPFLLRRLKSGVNLELPPKQEQIVWVEMPCEQRTFYDELLSEKRKILLSKIQEDGAEKHRMEIFELLLRLRQICCHPALVDTKWERTSLGKYDLLLSDIQNLAEENRKTLVYSQFTQMLSLIRKDLDARKIPYLYLDGKTKNRGEVVEQFQNDPSKAIFLLSLKAGGVGLNLTQAEYVLLYDPWWNDAIEAQAISRAHRIGKQTPLIAKRYVTMNSVEEQMLKLKERKSQLFDQLIDNTTTNLNDLLVFLSLD